MNEFIKLIEEELRNSSQTIYRCKDGTEIHTDVGYIDDWFNEYKKVILKNNKEPK